MSKAAKTVFYFGIYMIIEGLVLMFVPNMLLSLVGIPPTTEVWIRFLGLFFIILGYYYIRAGQTNWVNFFHWSVPVRIFQFLVVLTFVLLNLIPPQILIFSGIELLSGLWTWQKLKS